MCVAAALRWISLGVGGVDIAIIIQGVGVGGLVASQTDVAIAFIVYIARTHGERDLDRREIEE